MTVETIIRPLGSSLTSLHSVDFPEQSNRHLHRDGSAHHVIKRENGKVSDSPYTCW